MSTRSIIAAVVILSACGEPAGWCTEMPVAAAIVDVPSERRDWGEPIGNIRVTFADGHAELWTKLGRCMLVRHAQSGLVGWTRYSSRNSHAEPVNHVLRVMITAEHWRDFQAGPFIEDWAFTDRDSSVVIKSRGRHGPASFLCYSITTGKLIAAAKGITPYAELAAWAQPFADDKPR